MSLGGSSNGFRRAMPLSGGIIALGKRALFLFYAIVGFAVLFCSFITLSRISVSALLHAF
jgi:hypothetical protein